MCRKVDVTGAEIAEIKRVSEGPRYRTYVLMALPMGEANQLKKDKINAELSRNTAHRATEAFKELDSATSGRTQ
jgi:predicted ATPase